MSKFNAKQMHALIDELFDAGQVETLTALSTIMLALARNDAEDSNLDLEDDEKPSSKRKTSAKKVRGGNRRKAAAEADDGDDDAEDGEDGDEDADDADDLSGLDGLDVDDEDDKPAKKKRGRKAAVEEDDDDGDGADADLPVLESAKKFEAFLDEVDQLEDGLELPEGGMRDHVTELASTFNIVAADIDLGDQADLEGRELRQAKTAIYGLYLAKMQYIVDQLVEAGDKVIAAVAKAQDVDLDGIKGRGKGLLKKQAEAIVEAMYGEEEEGDDE